MRFLIFNQASARWHLAPTGPTKMRRGIAGERIGVFLSRQAKSSIGNNHELLIASMLAEKERMLAGFYLFEK